MPGSKLFSGMRFTASGLVKGDKIKLAALVTYHGGEYSRSLDDKCTHLVTHRSVGAKYDKALTRLNKVTCVTPGWVLTSAKNRILKNTADYDPANVIPGSEILPDISSSQSGGIPGTQTITTTASQPILKPVTKAVRNIRRKKSPNNEKRVRAKPGPKKSNQASHQHQQAHPVQQHQPQQHQPQNNQITLVNPTTVPSSMMQTQTSQHQQSMVRISIVLKAILNLTFQFEC